MVHFTCDLCGKDLNVSGDPRYVIKIAAYAGFDPNEITEGDLEDDHMEEISQILQRDENTNSEELENQTFKGFRFDLCSECHSRYLKDPLGKELLRSFDFSKN